MIFVNYLSTKDREKLRYIDELIQNCTSMEERAELFAKRAEIENKRKPLHECNIDECMDLSKQLYDQLQQHIALGNRTQMAQFQQMIAGVNQRTAALYNELNKEVMKKQQEAEKKKKLDLDDDETPSDKAGKRKTKKRKSSNHWTISVDQFD